MPRIAAAFAALLVAGCATQQATAPSTPVRARPPTNYEATVTNYFDLMMEGPQDNRRLSVGAPEASDCILFGRSAYQGWVVPVIYDTTPPPGSPAAARPAPKGKAPPARNTANNPAQRGAAALSNATTAAAATPAAAGNDGPTPTASLREVEISGVKYFFWFTNDTISAVSRRNDICP